MADRHFGKGFAQKHFAEKQFAADAGPPSGLTVEASTATILTTGQQAAVTLGSSRIVSATAAVITTTAQPANVSRGLTVKATAALVTTTAQQAAVSAGGRLVSALPALIATQALPANVSTGRLVAATTAAITTVGQPATIALGAGAPAAYVVSLKGLMPSANAPSALRKQTFEIPSGSFVQLRIAVTDFDGQSSELGGTGRFILSRRSGVSPALDSETVGSNVLVTLDDGGIMLVTITDDDSDALSDRYQWEAWVKDPSDRDVQVARGYLDARPSLRMAV
jgi:hypothetical protein